MKPSNELGVCHLLGLGDECGAGIDENLVLELF